ncbi:putative Acetyl-CoA C-acetyltransferase [Mesorhizobium delmotii]|uniref:Putative Acetyl-CoA C-acetyltransferase n=1 Tax=Mesorhizobium delmotii TaxID=1631247 RepID=A0A2P9AWN0_9HYPH|nr:putative Acetyl-CoA C-acetyltransferase [Mesorhizobium delmotii]
MSKTSIVIAVPRAPVGSFNGAFAATPAHELGAVVIKELLSRAGVEPAEVDEVILGQVLTAAQGQNPARQASINAGLPKETTAWGLNQVCGSGLRAIALGMQQIATGDAKVIVAGWQESMSLAPHAQHLRAGVKMGDYKMIDIMIRDGLWDAFNGYHMGNTAENVARQFQITRDDQDQLALASQNKAEAAQKAGKFKDEIVAFTVKGKKGDTIVDQDEYIRHGATIEAMTKLRPAFDKDGTVTAANASGINDGAAAVLLMTEAEAAKRGITPLARIVSWATAGVDPQIMGHRAYSRLAQGAGQGRLVGWRSRPGRGQRSLRRSGLRRQQGHGLGPVHRQCQWRRHRHRPSDRRLRCPHLQHAGLRDAPQKCQEGPRHAVHRRRHGRRHVRGSDELSQQRTGSSEWRRVASARRDIKGGNRFALKG